MHPEVGLHYYRARYYDRKLGRFISEDPIRLRGGTNFYAYVGGNPTSRIDPSGKIWGLVIVGGAIVGVAAYYLSPEFHDWVNSLWPTAAEAATHIPAEVAPITGGGAAAAAAETGATALTNGAAAVTGAGAASLEAAQALGGALSVIQQKQAAQRQFCIENPELEICRHPQWCPK